MTGAELEDLFSAATPRPWSIDPRSEVVESSNEQTTGEPICAMFAVNSAQNAAGIVALANHADALVELVRACETTTAFEFDGYDFVDRVKAALTRVHAVGKPAPA